MGVNKADTNSRTIVNWARYITNLKGVRIFNCQCSPVRSDEVFDCYRHEQRKFSLLINVNLFFLCHQILVNVLASLVCNVVPKSTICFSDVYICDR